MQKIFFLFFLLMMLCFCQDPKELAQKLELQKLLAQYHRLPEVLQQEDLADILLLNKTDQKIKLYKTIQRAKKILKEDSLSLAYLKEPYYDFDKQRFTGPYAKPKFEKFFFLVRDQILLLHTVEYYHFESGYFTYKNVYNDPKLDCARLYGTNAYFKNSCAKVIARKTKKLTPQELALLEQFIEESSFKDLPGNIERPGCLDGNVAIFFLVKEGDAKLIHVRCTGDVPIIKTLLEKTATLIDTDSMK